LHIEGSAIESSINQKGERLYQPYRQPFHPKMIIMEANDK
jgi:hypothetical protein